MRFAFKVLSSIFREPSDIFLWAAIALVALSGCDDPGVVSAKEAHAANVERATEFERTHPFDPRIVRQTPPAPEELPEKKLAEAPLPDVPPTPVKLQTVRMGSFKCPHCGQIVRIIEEQ